MRHRRDGGEKSRKKQGGTEVGPQGLTGRGWRETRCSGVSFSSGFGRDPYADSWTDAQGRTTAALALGDLPSLHLTEAALGQLTTTAALLKQGL